VTSNWVQKGNQLSELENYYGSCVSMNYDGSIIAVGSLQSKTYIYYYSNDIDQWANIGTITGSQDFMGHNIKLNSLGNIIAISNYTDNESRGIVNVYQNTYVNNEWIQLGSSITGNNINEFVGEYIAINNTGTKIAISKVGDPLNQGGVDVYIYNTDWEQLGTTIRSGTNNDKLGIGCTMNADGSVIACSSDNIDGTNTNKVRVFSFNAISNDGLIDIFMTFLSITELPDKIISSPKFFLISTLMLIIYFL
jgi:hypothetical protein